MPILTVNGAQLATDATPDTPLLGVRRDELNLTGTRFGCGAGLCGACTVHLDGVPVRSCITPLAEVGKRRITTIEGLATHTAAIGPALQHAWERLNVAQCGYCQSGQLMSASALLKSKSRPTAREIGDAMNGNICRCGTYPRIRAAIELAAATIQASAKEAT